MPKHLRCQYPFYGSELLRGTPVPRPGGGKFLDRYGRKVGSLCLANS